MEKLLRFVLSGLALGAIYTLVALGFVLVFKATSVLNFAHGSFVMLTAYLATSLLVALDLSFIPGLLSRRGIAHWDYSAPRSTCG